MPDRPRKGPNVVLLVVALVAAIAIAAVIIGSSGGDDDDSGTTAATEPGTAQTQPVQIAGTPLAEYDQSQSPDPAAGTAAPAVTGTSFNGDPVTIGKGPALIVFVAHWCPHCQREVPLLVKYFGEHQPSGVDVYAVATSTTPDRPNYPPSTWLADEKWPFPVLADSSTYEAASAYGLSAFPYFVAIDKDGKVVARGTGELETGDVAALLEKAKG